MLRSHIRSFFLRNTASAFVILAVASSACAGTSSFRSEDPARNPTSTANPSLNATSNPTFDPTSNPTHDATYDAARWTTLSCASCVQAGVEVSVRNSVDVKGKSGRHTAARIRNLNPHAVALVLELVPHQATPMDAKLISEKWRLLLHPAGKGQDSSTVLVYARGLQDVVVHDVEAF